MQFLSNSKISVEMQRNLLHLHRRIETLTIPESSENYGPRKLKQRMLEGWLSAIEDGQITKDNEISIVQCMELAGFDEEEMKNNVTAIFGFAIESGLFKPVFRWSKDESVVLDSMRVLRTLGTGKKFVHPSTDEEIPSNEVHPYFQLEEIV